MTTILVVDDEYDFVQALRAVLEDDGYRVAVCSDGREALSYLGGGHRKDLPALVLLDTMMPHMNGLTMLGELRTYERLQKLPVVLMPPLGAELTEPQGCNDILPKPFNISALLEVVHKYDTRRGWD